MVKTNFAGHTKMLSKSPGLLHSSTVIAFLLDSLHPLKDANSELVFTRVSILGWTDPVIIFVFVLLFAEVFQHK